MSVERNISLNSITGVSISSLRDDWVILHINNPTKELGDPIFSCYFKTEFLVHLLNLTGSRINIDITNSIEYAKKIGKTANINFIKDEDVKKDDIYKHHTVHVCTGEPAN